MSAGGPTLHGEAARQNFLRKVAATHEQFIPHLQIEIDQLRVAGDWAYESGSLVVTLQPRQGGDISYIRQRYLEIWRREADGEWRIFIEMDNTED